MNKPEGYELNKIKFAKNGGTLITFEQSAKDKSITNIERHTIESPRDVHTDMIKVTDQMKEFFADVFNLRPYKVLQNKGATTTAKTEEAVKALKTTFDKLDKEILRRIEITSVEYVGQEDSVGIVISGSLTFNGYTENLKTPKINFIGETWGFEEAIENLATELESEVESYLFLNKSAEPDLFGNNNGKSTDNQPSKDNVVPINENLGEAELAATGTDDENF